MDISQYLPVLLFILVGVAVGIVPQVLGYLLGPNKPNQAKNSPYECGFEASLFCSTLKSLSSSLGQRL
jgi:NADH-quinone oxidoreductase subunit A